MSLKADINQALKKFMMEKKSIEVGTLRQIKTEIMKFETSAGSKEADDEQVKKILGGLVKQHLESIDIYKKNGREEAAEKEEIELELLRSFLPEEMGEAELSDIVTAAVAEVGATSVKDMGRVMKKSMDLIAVKGGAVDGRVLSEMVKKKLS